MPERLYSFRRQLTGITADRAMLQIQAPTDSVVRIIRAWVSQSSSETSLQTAVRLVRKSAAATVTAAVIANDIRPLDTKDTSVVQVGTSATGYNASTAGTTSDTLLQESFNIVGSGWLYLPVPEERIAVRPSAFIALEAVETIGTFLFDVGIIFAEL